MATSCNAFCKKTPQISLTPVFANVNKVFTLKT